MIFQLKAAAKLLLYLRYKVAICQNEAVHTKESLHANLALQVATSSYLLTQEARLLSPFPATFCLSHHLDTTQEKHLGSNGGGTGTNSWRTMLFTQDDTSSVKQP